MALTILHSTAPDGNFSASGASAWTAQHTVSGSLPETSLSFSDTTAGNVSASAHGFAPKFPNNTTTFLRGDGTYAAPTASVTWDTISAAAGSATTANATNNIVYNTAPTADSKVAWTFGEASAATNGTSTSGVPNQVLLQLSTLAASTQSPLSVYSRGTHVFSVSPTSAQIFGANGGTNTPMYSFASANSAGMWYTTTTMNRVVITVDGSGNDVLWVTAKQNLGFTAYGATNPTWGFQGDIGTGIYRAAASSVGISGNGTSLAVFTGGTNIALFRMSAMLFANLGTPADGSFAFCSDCDPGTLFNSTCASAGTKTGSFARRVNGAWLCD